MNYLFLAYDWKNRKWFKKDKEYLSEEDIINLDANIFNVIVCDTPNEKSRAFKDLETYPEIGGISRAERYWTISKNIDKLYPLKSIPELLKRLPK